MPAYTWDEIPDEPVRPGVRRRAFGTEDCMLVLNHCEVASAVPSTPPEYHQTSDRPSRLKSAIIGV